MWYLQRWVLSQDLASDPLLVLSDQSNLVQPLSLPTHGVTHVWVSAQRPMERHKSSQRNLKLTFFVLILIMEESTVV